MNSFHNNLANSNEFEGKLEPQLRESFPKVHNISWISDRLFGARYSVSITAMFVPMFASIYRKRETNDWT